MKNAISPNTISKQSTYGTELTKHLRSTDYGMLWLLPQVCTYVHQVYEVTIHIQVRT